MIRINLAKALGGKKGAGRPVGGIVYALLLLVLLVGGGAYYYVVYIQPEGFENSAVGKTLNQYMPDAASVWPPVAEFVGGVLDKIAAVTKSIGAGASEKIAGMTSKTPPDTSGKIVDTSKTVADTSGKIVADTKTGADTSEKIVTATKAVADTGKTAAVTKAATDTSGKTAATTKAVADTSAKTVATTKAAADTSAKTAAATKKPVDVLEITPPPTKTAEKKPADAIADAPKKPAAPAPKPSSLVRSNMAEDVVKEFDNEARAIASANKIAVTYPEMTVAEKINYEVAFGRNAFEMVTRCAPPGTKLKTLEIENFQTVYASGAGASREMVQEMFAAFKKERGELLPKPLSHIRDSEKGGYQFVITHKPLFGTEPNAPFQAIDYIGFKAGLTPALGKFSRAAGANGVKLAGAPAQASVEQAGQYRRFVYKASGVTTYQDFKKFVLALYGEKVTCAFKKVTMTPIKDEQVRVNMELLFTVKD